jgi:hypothetical protein
MFVRWLMVEVLKAHHSQGRLQPRIKRHLPVRALHALPLVAPGMLQLGTWCTSACQPVAGG